MWVRSLRWRLQAWHAVILLLVVAGFGSLFYLQSRRAKLDEIDAELLAGARVLEGVLRTVIPPGPGPELGPGPVGEELPVRRPPPPSPRRGRRRTVEDDLPPPPGPPPFEPPFPGGPPRAGNLEALNLPSSLVERYAEDGRGPYFAIWFPDGEVLRAEPSPPEAPPDDEVGRRRESHVRQRGGLREVTLLGPGRTRILVGRPIERELAELHRLGLRLGLSGLSVFLAGLVGGWWLSSRAVRPIRAMSETLARITARRLSERIDVADVDAELGQLGAILNEMLGRLEASFEQQVRFTADASHELRTPLSVILAHIELALSRARSAEEYREALSTCGRAGGRMKAMVDDLLTLARADAGQLELKAGRADLGTIAEESADLVQTLAARRGVRLEVTPGRSEVSGDPDRLAQVATNLITNAILYNRPGGRVMVSTATERDEAVFRVADTGIGIPEADLPLLFQRFYRADPARSREHGGSGLGLAICRSIVEAHGGRIAVESRAGEGTTVSVRLPAAGADGRS
jgi:heavy metal sensor kinase